MARPCEAQLHRHRTAPAKEAETRERRIRQALAMIAEGQRLKG